MAGVEGGERYQADALRAWTKRVFRKIGVAEAEAALLADSLIESNLRGVDTHGITRMLSVYVERIRRKVVSAQTRLELLRDSPSTALIDCHNSIGQVGADRAMRLAIEKAEATGVAFVAVTHSNHYGAAAYWAMLALERDMIGFSSTNAPATMAPTGGREAMLGTNPFAIAIPAGREPPFVLDLATTLVSRGRIALYAKQDRPLEPGWALDECGLPTLDPQAALSGLLAPMGGYKGYGIALAIDLLCGAMTGSSYGAHFPGFLADNMESPTDVGSVFAAIKISNFMDPAEFRSAVDAALRELKTSAKAEGVERIYVPGELALKTKAERLERGIPIPEPVALDFRRLGEELGLPFPEAAR
ncbi:MAG TPA: Ldh family oxidoreductase [Rectinemataceae bacterium]|nr:Ldh family oxidoreductase [Rectinemataceae bacterium]